MIVDDSFSRLTTRMIVFRSAVFPENRRARLKRPPQVSREAQLQLPAEIHNHDKENIEDQGNIQKISSEENVNSQELEETPQTRSVSLNVHRVRRAMRRDGVMT